MRQVLYLLYSLGDFLMDTLITRSRDSLLYSEDAIFVFSDGHINQPGAGILCSTHKMLSLDFLMDTLINLELGSFVPLRRCHLWIF